MFEYYQQEANPRGLGPPPPNAYKRAVLKDPPKQFKVSVLPPKKIGSGWAYGVHVISTAEEEIADASSISAPSIGLSPSSKDYEIWRRWDDCLWFQETLELEYSIQAREKRRRLEQGKGVKKNGVYLDSKRAASFESLPPGPHPTSVSLNIHEYIPKLSKKATLFRVNQATIDMRQQQFSRLIEALFAPEVPALLEELRETTTVRNFFGWWRRDKDFARKQGPDKGRDPELPILDSIPIYFDASNPSQVFSISTTSSRDPPSSRSKPARPATADSAASDSIWSNPRTCGSEDSPLRKRRATFTATPSTPAIAISSASTSSSHESRRGHRASVHSATSGEIGPTVVMWDGQEQLNASDRVSPHALLNAFPQTPMVRETFENIQCPPSPEADSPILGLEALPEEPEPELLQASAHEHDSGRRPPRRNSILEGHHRNAIVFSPEIVLSDTETPEIPDHSPTWTTATVPSSRYPSLFSNISFTPSWRTSASDLPPCPSPRRSLESCTTDPVDYSSSSPVTPQTPWLSDSEILPTLGQSKKRNRRESIMSINSIMTDASVDQVLPRGTHTATQSGDSSAIQSFSLGPRSRLQTFVPMSVPEEEGYLEDCDEGILESYLYGTEEMDTSAESEGISEDHYPYRERLSQHPTSEQLPKPFQNRPPGQFHLPWTPTSPTALHSPLNMEDTSKPPTSPTSMTSMSMLPLKAISIKAYITEDAIVVFRTAAETAYAEIREKIHDKFANQEGISLRPDFPLAFLTPACSRRSTTSSVYSGVVRGRARSVESAPNKSSLFVIQSQEAWDELVRDSDGKLILRVFE